MVKEKPQEALDFPFPYYAYAEKSLTIPATSERTLTLTLSESVYGWGHLMITASAQAGSCYVNIDPYDGTTARIRVWNYNSSSITAIIRVMALLPFNGTISLS